MTEYLDSVRFDGTAVGQFLTFGGFDQDRYARRLGERIRSRGATAVEALLVKRDRLEPAEPASTGIERDVARFVASVVERAANPDRPDRSEDGGEVG